LVAIRAIRSLSRASPTHWRTDATTDAGAALDRIAHVRNCIIMRALESQTNGNNGRFDLFAARFVCKYMRTGRPPERNSASNFMRTVFTRTLWSRHGFIFKFYSGDISCFKSSQCFGSQCFWRWYYSLYFRRERRTKWNYLGVIRMSVSAVRRDAT
jgi:hypothetical protein